MTDQEAIAKKLDAIPEYRALFQEAFGGKATGLAIRQALGAFLRALESGNSPYDRFVQGDRSAMSDEAQRGFEAFKRLGCSSCHAPPLFSDWKFHDAGIGFGAAAESKDLGRGERTKLAEDEGRFRTPSLRNVANSGPWFHDGSASTLDDAISKMAAPAPHTGLDPLFQPHALTPTELRELRAFLEALTGPATLVKPSVLPDGKKPS